MGGRAKVVFRENLLGDHRQSGMVSASAEVNLTGQSRDNPHAGSNGTSTVG